MEKKDIQTVRTTRGELQYYRDWDNYEGGIVMQNAQTVKRYREIKEQHPDADECGVFFAFSNKQFEEGYKHLVELGHIKEGDKITPMGGGGYGTRAGIEEFIGFYEKNTERIKEECDPQEVYFYEYNNHESMIAWDGDLEAIKIIIDLWGADVARKIKRFNASQSVENLVRKPIPLEGLYFEYNGERKEPSSLYFGINGLCHTMYDNALHPVYDTDGNLVAIEELSNISASYDGKHVYNFYRE